MKHITEMSPEQQSEIQSKVVAYMQKAALIMLTATGAIEEGEPVSIGVVIDVHSAATMITSMAGDPRRVSDAFIKAIVGISQDGDSGFDSIAKILTDGVANHPDTIAAYIAMAEGLEEALTIEKEKALARVLELSGMVDDETQTKQPKH